MNTSSSGMGISSGSSGVTPAPTTTTTTNSQPRSTVASVHFKARCELLGHGEDVYMVPLEDNESGRNSNNNNNAPLPRVPVRRLSCRCLSSMGNGGRRVLCQHLQHGRSKDISMNTSANTHPMELDASATNTSTSTTNTPTIDYHVLPLWLLHAGET